MEQVTVYSEPGRFAGWPANYGMWAWGDELVVGFVTCHYERDAEFHARDENYPALTKQARSLDGGRSWTVIGFPGKTPGGRGLSADEHMAAGLRVGELLDGPDGPKPQTEAVDFTHPDFAFMCARDGLEPGCRSFYYLSFDRAKNWQGPFAFPQFVWAGVAARTDYLVLGPSHLIVFLTANKADGVEGRVFSAETRDGGLNWKFLSWIGEELPDLDHGIMPASLRLADGTILVATRAGHGQDYTVEIYRSTDEGKSWEGPSIATAFRDRHANHLGNPATLNLMPDGRVALTYGNRDAPYTIDARISADGGRSWSAARHLRRGGGNHDLGYPRTVANAAGELVTAYYFNEALGERFIGATIWTP